MRGGAPRRVFGYCRVSSDRQEREGTSLEGQRDEITRWCRSKGYPPPILAVEVESGSAEKTEERHEQVRLTAEVGEGDIVVAVAVDRWSRDIVHAVSSVRSLVKRDVGWYAIRESIDASTPQGDSTLGIMAWTADQERRRIRERTVGRRRELADQGHYVAGTLPLGYARTKDRKLVVVEEEAAIVREIFTRCIDGESLPEIAATLPPVRKRTEWTVHAVHKVLRSRYGLGEQRRGDGTWQEGAHPAIVTYETWEKAHEAMRARVHGGRAYANGESATRLLRGLAVCSACGRKVSMRFGSKKGRGEPGLTYAHYYVCRGVLAKECGEGWNSAPPLDAEAARLAVERLVELRDELAKPPSAPAAKKRAGSKAALAKIEAKRRRAIDLATEGALPAADLRGALARLEDEAATVRRRAEKEAAEGEAAARAADPTVRAEIFRQAKTWRHAWTKMTIERRQETLMILAVRVEVGRQGVRCIWRSAAELAGAWTERRRIT